MSLNTSKSSSSAPPHPLLLANGFLASTLETFAEQSGRPLTQNGRLIFCWEIRLGTQRSMDQFFKPETQILELPGEVPQESEKWQYSEARTDKTCLARSCCAASSIYSPFLGHQLVPLDIIYFFFLIWDRLSVSVCSSGCPRTYSVDQIGLEFTESHLLLPLQCWD